MALRGTLKDFGIADIFQLIGHQGKTGVLTARNRDQEVKVQFSNGNIAGVESATRNRRDLLGSILVRAEVVTEAQLLQALETQKKTLRRIGDILLEQGAIDSKTLKSFARLQMSETTYRLFVWDSGVYEFQQADVQVSPDTELLRAENVLMEGFRQVDEWPLIRRHITGYGMTFEKLEDLDTLAEEEAPAAAAADDLNLDDAFGDLSGDGGDGGTGKKKLGPHERAVFQLIQADRDVQKIIDLSRLGEFETCKALLALIEAGIIEPLPEGHRKPSGEATVGGITAQRRTPWLPALNRVLLSLALGGAVVAGAVYLGSSPHAWNEAHRSMGYVLCDVQSELSRGQLGKIRHALEVYRAETGRYPVLLTELVQAGLLRERDVRAPWAQSYSYVARDGSYTLVRPLL